MNYRLHYERLIERARTRVLSGYIETHHVLPRCMGGEDTRRNLVQLTAEEHFVAHQLLYKMHPEVKGLGFALVSMNGDRYGQRSNKLYGWICRKVALAQSDVANARWSDPEYREKHQRSMQSVRATTEYREKLSKAQKGRVKSVQERANIAEAGRRRARRVFSPEARANMAEARRKTWQERRERGEHLLIAAKTRATRIKNGSYEFSEEHKAKLGESLKRARDKRKTATSGRPSSPGGLGT